VQCASCFGTHSCGNKTELIFIKAKGTSVLCLVSGKGCISFEREACVIFAQATALHPRAWLFRFFNQPAHKRHTYLSATEWAAQHKALLCSVRVCNIFAAALAQSGLCCQSALCSFATCHMMVTEERARRGGEEACVCLFFLVSAAATINEERK